MSDISATVMGRTRRCAVSAAPLSIYAFTFVVNVDIGDDRIGAPI